MPHSLRTGAQAGVVFGRGEGRNAFLQHLAPCQWGCDLIDCFQFHQQTRQSLEFPLAHLPSLEFQRIHQYGFLSSANAAGSACGLGDCLLPAA